MESLVVRPVPLVPPVLHRQPLLQLELQEANLRVAAIQQAVKALRVGTAHRPVVAPMAGKHRQRAPALRAMANLHHVTQCNTLQRSCPKSPQPHEPFGCEAGDCSLSGAADCWEERNRESRYWTNGKHMSTEPRQKVLDRRPRGGNTATQEERNGNVAAKPKRRWWRPIEPASWVCAGMRNSQSGIPLKPTRHATQGAARAHPR